MQQFQDAIRIDAAAREDRIVLLFCESAGWQFGCGGWRELQAVCCTGDAPGFCHVLDSRTIAIPDRKGNNRIDTLQARPRNVVFPPDFVHNSSSRRSVDF